MVLIQIISIWLAFTYSSHKEVSINFYSSNYNLKYEKGLFINHKFKADDKNIIEFEEKVKSTSISGFVEQLDSIKQQNKWNDWIYYKFIESSVGSILKKKSLNLRKLYVWYILRQSGYDVKLAYLEGGLEMFYKCGINIYNRTKIGSYYSFNLNKTVKGKFFKSSLIPDLRSFSLGFEEMPQFPNSKIEIKKIRFYNKVDERYEEIDVEINSTFIQVLNDYPELDLRDLYNIPFSNETYNTLIPELYQIIRGKSKEDASNILLSFTRATSAYRKDSNDKWMTPMEAIYYEGKDCEDFSSLYFYLMKELVKIPLVIIQYPEFRHVNIGVGLDSVAHDQIIYNTRSYSVTDPTGGSRDIEEVGMNELYKKWNYKIGGEYLPKGK